MWIFYLTALFGFTCGLVRPEPRCSAFHYEEQTLEKMIRMEIKMEGILKEMDDMKQDVVEITESSPNLRRTVVYSGLRFAFKTTFVRWGRTSCPNTLGTKAVYRGYMAGNIWKSHGGGVNSLCLPEQPSWKNYVRGHQNAAKIYGAELETSLDVSTGLFSNRVMNNQDIPCVVCEAPRRATLMVPGRNSCYGNWTTEYAGYLVSSSNGWKGSSFFSCLDADFEPIPGDYGDNGHVLQPVEVACGTLPCPPYIEGAEVACVVCTK